MTEKKISANTYNNYQRILSSHTSTSIALMTLVFTFNSAGLAGLFTIATSTLSDNLKWLYRLGLSAVLIFITVSLFVVWLREHALKGQAVSDLENKNIEFPNTKKWKGWTRNVWFCVYIAGLGFWGVIFFVSFPGIRTLLCRFICP